MFVVHQMDEAILDREQFAVRVVEDVANFRAGKAEIQRNRHGAEPVAGVDQFGVTKRVVADDAEAIANADPEGFQYAGGAGDAVDVLRPGQIALAIEDRRAGGEKIGRPRQRGSHGQSMVGGVHGGLVS